LLFTPPGYQGTIPQGYIHVASPNFRIALAFRSVPAPGKSVADAYRYAQKLRMYYVSEAGNPPKQRSSILSMRIIQRFRSMTSATSMTWPRS
jgi:hypothetical protein